MKNLVFFGILFLTSSQSFGMNRPGYIGTTTWKNLALSQDLPLYSPQNQNNSISKLGENGKHINCDKKRKDPTRSQLPSFFRNGSDHSAEG